MNIFLKVFKCIHIITHCAQYIVHVVTLNKMVHTYYISLKMFKIFWRSIHQLSTHAYQLHMFCNSEQHKTVAVML